MSTISEMTGSSSSSSNHPAARSNYVPETPLQKFDAALLRIKALFQLKKSKTPKVPFPPPSWFEDGKVVNPGASEAAAIPLLEDASNGDLGGGGEQQDGDEAPPPPATWIARKIQEMIDAFPPGSPPCGSTSDPSPNKPSTPNQPADSPQPPPPVDSKLAQLLATAYIMNGSISRGRRSVWAALEKLGPPPHGLHRDGGGAEGDEDERISLMICSPLIPDSKELPEIASCHMETIVVEAEVEGEQSNTVQASKWPWPFSKWNGNDEGGPTPGDDKGKAPEVPGKRQVRVWEPSSTKLSIEVLWWGYRLYLPPPVLAVLSDKSLEASKRAALVTAALKWLVDHIPVKMLPPPLQPAVILLQTLIPFVGYIGAFIAWSFGAINSFNKGHGVILTATWLLPVALIPGTWEAEEVPKPATDPSPAPQAGGTPAKTPADKTPSAPAPAPGPSPTPPVPPVQADGPITSTPVVVPNKKKKGRLV